MPIKPFDIFRSTLQSGLCVELDTQGTSMFPLIITRHRVVIEPLGERTPKRGDVVVFFNRANEGFVSHRVLKVDAETLITQGDANLKPDNLVSMSDLLGFVRETTWLFDLRIRHASRFAKVYGRIQLALSPLSNFVNFVAARSIRAVYHIFVPSTPKP